MDNMEQQAGNVKAEQPEEKQPTGGDESAKTFTQEEVNQIVRERLARERKQIDKILDEEGYSKELLEREKNITQRELKAEARDHLVGEKKMPVEVLELINYDSQEAYTNSMNIVETVLNKLAVKAPKDEKAPQIVFQGNARGPSAQSVGDKIKEAFKP